MAPMWLGRMRSSSRTSTVPLYQHASSAPPALSVAMSPRLPAGPQTPPSEPFLLRSPRLVPGVRDYSRSPGEAAVKRRTPSRGIWGPPPLISGTQPPPPTQPVRCDRTWSAPTASCVIFIFSDRM